MESYDAAKPCLAYRVRFPHLSDSSLPLPQTLSLKVVLLPQFRMQQIVLFSLYSHYPVLGGNEVRVGKAVRKAGPGSRFDSDSKPPCRSSGLDDTASTFLGKMRLILLDSVYFILLLLNEMINLPRWGWGNPLGKVHRQGLQLFSASGWQVPGHHFSRWAESIRNGFLGDVRLSRMLTLCCQSFAGRLDPCLQTSRQANCVLHYFAT